MLLNYDILDMTRNPSVHVAPAKQTAPKSSQSNTPVPSLGCKISYTAQPTPLQKLQLTSSCFFTKEVAENIAQKRAQ